MKHKRAMFWLGIIVVLLAGLAVIWPLFRNGFFISDDGEWMVIRLSAFYQSLSSGQFPVRYLGRLNNSYGYPVANFLYPGFLYIGSILHLSGFSFPDAVKIILGGSVLGASLCVYIALRKRHTVVASLFGAVSMLYSPYLIYDLYHRGSVGEILAVVPASMLMVALELGLFWLLPVSIAVLIISHNTTALIVGLAFAVILITTQKNPWRFVIHALLGLGMSAFFWLPAILETRLVRFDSVTVSNPSQYFISLSQAYLLGFSTVLFLVIFFTVRAKKQMLDKMIAILITLAYVLATPVSTLLWASPTLTKLVQFPYRFLIIPVVFGPWLVAYVVSQLSGLKRYGVIFIAMVLWIPLLINMESQIQFVTRPIGFYTTNEGTTTVADEYMPKTVTEIPKNRTVDIVDVVSGDASLSAHTFRKESIDVTVDAKVPSVVEINKVFYPGWGVSIDGSPTVIDYNNPFGIMRITVPTGVHTLKAAFRETPTRFIIDIVSIASIVLYFILLRRLA